MSGWADQDQGADAPPRRKAPRRRHIGMGAGGFPTEAEIGTGAGAGNAIVLAERAAKKKAEDRRSLLFMFVMQAKVAYLTQKQQERHAEDEDRL